mgnify:FL=1
MWRKEGRRPPRGGRGLKLKVNVSSKICNVAPPAGGVD